MAEVRSGDRVASESPQVLGCFMVVTVQWPVLIGRSKLLVWSSRCQVICQMTRCSLHPPLFSLILFYFYFLFFMLKK